MTLDPRILELITPHTNQYKICELVIEGLSYRKIAIQLNITDSYVSSAVSKAKKLAAKRGYSPEFDMTHPTPDGFLVKGVSTLYGDEGQIKQQWVKTDVDKTQFIEQMQELVQELVQELPKFEHVPYTVTNASSDLMAVYPLGDPHVGMLALKDESGADWNLKTAQSVFCGVFDRLVKVAPSCDQAVIVNLGDYFHYDNASKVTERSRNQLDVDGTYLDMADTGIKIMVQMINSALEHHKHVKVITAIGNHDDTGAMFLQACLKHMYQDSSRVEIVSTSSVFQYFQHGKCLVGVHHGHTAKMDKLPMVMATDKPEEWGESVHRYWLTGHIHHDSMKEYSGCKVESFRTLAGKDNYAASHGYRAGQDSKALVFHREFGEVERHTINIAQVVK